MFESWAIHFSGGAGMDPNVWLFERVHLFYSCIDLTISYDHLKVAQLVSIGHMKSNVLDSFDEKFILWRSFWSSTAYQPTI